MTTCGGKMECLKFAAVFGSHFFLVNLPSSLWISIFFVSLPSVFQSPPASSIVIINPSQLASGKPKLLASSSSSMLLLRTSPLSAIFLPPTY